MKFFAAIFVLFSSISTTFCCTCYNFRNSSEVQQSKYLKNVKAIFYGEVVSLGEKRVIEQYPGEISSYSQIYQPVKFKVLQAWKGVESVEITVEANVDSSCQYIAAIGDKTTFYAFEDSNLKVPLYISYCSTEHFDDEKMKRELGAGKLFEDSPQLIPETTQTTKGFWSNLWNKIVSLFS